MLFNKRLKNPLKNDSLNCKGIVKPNVFRAMYNNRQIYKSDLPVSSLSLLSFMQSRELQKFNVYSCTSISFRPFFKIFEIFEKF